MHGNPTSLVVIFFLEKLGSYCNMGSPAITLESSETETQFRFIIDVTVAYKRWRFVLPSKILSLFIITV